MIMKPFKSSLHRSKSHLPLIRKLIQWFLLLQGLKLQGVTLVSLNQPWVWLSRHVRGEMFLHSKVQAGEHLMMVYFRPMRALSETSLAGVFHDLHNYLCRKCDLATPHGTPGHRVPVGDRYTLLDLYFACAMMEHNMEAFFDDYRILQLKVITTSPSPSISTEGERCLAFAWAQALN